MKRILLSWSSGKDSAWSLHILRQRGEYEVVGLLTSFNQAADRVAMHAVRRSLVQQQADAAGLPLWAVVLPHPCSNLEYENAMRKACARAVSENIEGIAFGDLFLEDVRAYRERQMRGTGLQPVFPIWGIPTKDLAEQMIDSGLRAKLTCIDTTQLDAGFAGQEFDREFLSRVPDSVDPCGERGEFHSFVYAGPMLNSVIPVSVGQIRVEERFVFADLCRSDSRAEPKTRKRDSTVSISEISVASVSLPQPNPSGGGRSPSGALDVEFTETRPKQNGN